MTLKLDRPLAVIDLETTSVDVETARIVQIGIIILVDGGIAEHRDEMLVNPGVPISPEAVAVHGITDDMVADAPSFEDVAAALMDDLEGCDLAGFNLEKFDIPILARHFAECEIDFPGDRKIIDVMTIFHRNEKRDLAGACRFYLGCEHTDAHSALADAQVTREILVRQVERYGLPANIALLDAYCHEKPADYVDADGRLKWQGGEAVFAFGKVKGQTLRAATAGSPDYLRWILNADFSPELKTIVGGALQGNFPVRSGKVVA